jgi:hypothetical protein
MTDEEFVRANWENVHRCDGSYILISKGGHRNFADFPGWQAAAQFTRDRLEAIRQIEEEIEWLRGMCAWREHGIYGPRYDRILAREQAALADLKRGMKASA